MKFNFKIQQYQTEAVDAVVKVFEGQPYRDGLLYRRDLGKYQAAQQISMVSNSGEIEDIDDFDKIGRAHV